VSAISESELNLALKALRRQLLNEPIPLESEPEQSSEYLSAILLTVSLAHLASKDALPGLWRGSVRKRLAWSLDESDHMSLACELHAQLRDFAPDAIELNLARPSLESIIFARRLFGSAPRNRLMESPSCIGFAYQICRTGFRKEALAKVQVANKMMAVDTLIAFTRIYTPDWVTDFLAANALLPLVPESCFNGAGNDARFRRWLLNGHSKRTDLKRLEDIKIIDPACGAGHFLLSAYDLLRELYAKQGMPVERAAQEVLTRQLFGADIDETGLSVACLALLTKKLIDAPRVSMRLNGIASARHLPGSKQTELLGSISKQWSNISGHILSSKYDVVMTNPPYIGRRLISRELKGALSHVYPLSRTDLAAAFLEGAFAMLSEGGRLAVITQSSLMSLPSYRKFREFIDRTFETKIAIDCGSGVFPLLSGEKADSVLLVIEKPTDSPSQPVAKIKLSRAAHQADQLLKLIPHLLESSGSAESAANSEHQLTRLFEPLREAPQIQNLASVRQGLATTNNARFVRFYWDVDEKEIGSTWVPYVKGAGSERWYAPNLHVVKWAGDGSEIKQAVKDAYPYLGGKTAWVVKNEQFYFKPGLCFSFINKRCLAVRRLPKGCIFDVASSAIFAGEEQDQFLLGYLNSTFASAIVSRINPTINVQVGDVKKVPCPPVSSTRFHRISELANQCYAAKEAVTNLLEHPFELNQIASDWDAIWRKEEQKHARLAFDLSQLEQELDEEVTAWIAEAMRLDNGDRRELRNWLAQFKESLTADGKFLSKEQLFGKLVHDLAGKLIARGEGDALVILPCKQNGEELQLSLKLACRSAFGIDGTVFEDARILSCLVGRRVQDLARSFRGPSRYLSLGLPTSGTTLLLSRRAVSKFFGLSAKEKQNYWAGNFQRLGLSTDIQSVTECESLLQKAQSILSAKKDWTTKDLITAVDSSIRQ
jgi:hypothetical protein